MKIGKTSHQIALQQDGYQKLVSILMLMHFVASWFVMSVVVFLRRDFGERYLSWVNLLFGYMIVAFFGGFGNAVIAYASGESASQIIGPFALAFIGLSIYHRRRIQKRIKTGIEWHSRYSGTPLLKTLDTSGKPWLKHITSLDEETINKWIEPGLILLLAILARNLHSTPMAVWLFLSGFSLLLHEHISYYLQREWVLDGQDARIEARYYQEAVAGKPAQETAGYTIARSHREIINATRATKAEPEHETKAADPFETLSPDLKNIMDKGEEGATA